MVECDIEVYNILLGFFAGQLYLLYYALKIIIVIGLIKIVLRIIDKIDFKKLFKKKKKRHRN